MVKVSFNGWHILEKDKNFLKEETITDQGSKGIRQLMKNLCISPMMIHKTTPSVE